MGGALAHAAERVDAAKAPASQHEQIRVDVGERVDGVARVIRQQEPARVDDDRAHLAVVHRSAAHRDEPAKGRTRPLGDRRRVPGRLARLGRSVEADDDRARESVLAFRGG